MAVTQADVFEYFRTERKTPNLDKRIHYILRLPVSEVHLLARTEFAASRISRARKSASVRKEPGRA